MTGTVELRESVLTFSPLLYKDASTAILGNEPMVWFKTAIFEHVPFCVGGLKELKVFVDLASISAGEEPYAIDSVNCFHTTAIGYAPLIFMEAKDKDFAYLLEQIKLVLSSVNDDPNLPQKLVSMYILHIHTHVAGTLSNQQTTTTSYIFTYLRILPHEESGPSTSILQRARLWIFLSKFQG